MQYPVSTATQTSTIQIPINQDDQQPQKPDATLEETNSDIQNISKFLSYTTTMNAWEDACSVCKDYLGKASDSEFEERKTTLLELALEYSLSEHSEEASCLRAPLIIATAIKRCYWEIECFDFDEELNYFLEEKSIYTKPKYNSSDVLGIFQKVADSGRKVAQCYVGLIYANAQDPIKNISLARRYLQLSAAQRYEPAITALQGLPKTTYQQACDAEKTDSQKAFKLYLKAANEENDKDAMFRLGELAKGVNNDKALEWFGKADENGHKGAAEEIADIYANGITKLL